VQALKNTQGISTLFYEWKGKCAIFDDKEILKRVKLFPFLWKKKALTTVMQTFKFREEKNGDKGRGHI
jgi:hypothetical protein